MKQLNVDLENCYGIKKLQFLFDFTGAKKAYAIYAPNGAMKSSLAQTFKDVSDGAVSKDRIFPNRVTVRKITDEDGNDLPSENVLVVPPYDEVFSHTEKTSTLLVDQKLRKEYEQLHQGIGQAQDRLLKALKQQSGSKKDLEREVSLTFTKSDKEFIKALARVQDEISNQKDAPFANVKYDIIFDEKVSSLLNTKDFKSAIEDYVKKYNELILASTYFKKGVFNYYNAATIAKSLSDNGFFDANHTVSLNSKDRLEISSQKQLEELIAQEKEAITKDAGLKKKFAEIDKLINKNATLRDFQSYIEEREDLLPLLSNMDAFREEIWKSYLKDNFEPYSELLEKHRAAEKRRKEIEAEAAKQRTQWEEVIDIFNDRFFVPFKLEAKNRIPVILGEEPMLILGFSFKDGTDSTSVDRDTLLQALSTGEKKALYILNIIFEVQVRRKAGQSTVFILDDIADSFDYKNKYAIIQYLMDIAQVHHFRQIVLTHNFDFFRTINGRSLVSYPNCLMISKNSEGVSLVGATGFKNIFVNDWKPHFFSDPKKKIASIPFMRNIIEYTKGDQDQDYLKLTSLLHWKPDTHGITQGELDGIYCTLFGATERSLPADKPVADLIQELRRVGRSPHEWSIPAPAGSAQLVNMEIPGENRGASPRQHSSCRRPGRWKTPRCLRYHNLPTRDSTGRCTRGCWG